MHMNPTRFIWKQDRHSPNPVAEDLTAIHPLLSGDCTDPKERLEARIQGTRRYDCRSGVGQCGADLNSITAGIVTFNQNGAALQKLKFARSVTVA